MGGPKVHEVVEEADCINIIIFFLRDNSSKRSVFVELPPIIGIESRVLAFLLNKLKPEEADWFRDCGLHIHNQNAIVFFPAYQAYIDGKLVHVSYDMKNVTDVIRYYPEFLKKECLECSRCGTLYNKLTWKSFDRCTNCGPRGYLRLTWRDNVAN